MQQDLMRVMCVDDEPDILDVATMALEMVGGLQVQSCTSGVQALDELKQAEPDVILMDVMMPELDGPGTLAALRQLPQHRDRVVVFMTAHVQAEKQQELVALGALACISKPFDPMTLADQVKAIWAQRGAAANASAPQAA